MNRRKSRRYNRNKNEKPKNVIRCNLNQKIVWDNELCSDFIVNRDSTKSAEKICKNCKYSF